MEPNTAVLEQTPEPGDLTVTENVAEAEEVVVSEEPAIVAELVIEEISIDGMCGVY